MLLKDNRYQHCRNIKKSLEYSRPDDEIVKTYQETEKCRIIQESSPNRIKIIKGKLLLPEKNGSLYCLLHPKLPNFIFKDFMKIFSTCKFPL